MTKRRSMDQPEEDHLPVTVVRINQFLQLSPPAVEEAFWCSPAAVRVLRASDLFCVANAVLTSCMLIRTFGTGSNSGMTWHYQLPMLVYACMNVTQMALLLLQPEVYQKHRFQLTLVSRSLRLVGIAWCSYHTAQGDMARMLGAVQHNEMRRSAPGFLNLMRMLLVPPMAVFNHANFILPFVYVLPAQLWTFVTCSWMLRTSACIVAAQDGHLRITQHTCSVLRAAMYNLAMLLGGPSLQSPAAAPKDGVQQCGALQGVVLLGLYLHVILLLVVPCLAVYLIELNMKVSFVRSQGLGFEQTWAIMDSSLIKAVAGYGAVVGGWMACEMSVLTVAPLRCSDQGLLTWSVPLFQQHAQA